jgi:CarD family transcriptional regulator
LQKDVFIRRNIITINQGDRIYHPSHGIGLVKSILNKSFFGENETRFVKFYFERDSLTWLVRATDIPGNIRRTINAKEARNVIKHMENWQGRMSEQWKSRANANQAVLDSGDPLRCAEVIKDLSIMREQGTLRAADRTHLNLGIEYLSEELASALGKSHDRVRHLIEKAVSSQPVT